MFKPVTDARIVRSGAVMTPAAGKAISGVALMTVGLGTAGDIIRGKGVARAAGGAPSPLR